MVKGRRSVPYQHSFIMKVSSGDRVVFDILQRQHVQELLESPIIVNQTTYHAHQSRFIIPKFGYDVAITGCGSIGHFKAGMDAVIRNHFGGQDVIAHSRMELDGDTYVVIMRTCDLAAKLVDSTLPNPSGMDSPSHDGTAMQQQVDLLREQVNSGAANFSQILRTQGEQISEIRSANNNLQNAMALASALTDARLRVMAFDGEVARLESDKTTKQMLLLFAAVSPDLKATFSASLEDIQRRLVVVGRDHTAARADLDGLAALNRARLVGQTPLDSQRVGEGPPTNRPRRDDEMNEG
ncbi:hypothetical protein BDZ89DRAFT_1067062 [Hymenopellis radicata]|nr:hypothetical protein BDZ89DRAFT_1067062 [Hymenopellis radicata]